MVLSSPAVTSVNINLLLMIVSGRKGFDIKIKLSSTTGVTMGDLAALLESTCEGLSRGEKRRTFFRFW